MPYLKPKLPTHFYVWCDPPDDNGDEALHFVSERRRVKLKGSSFREFERRVIPMLDGKHSVEEIAASVGDIFSRSELESALDFMASQGLLTEGKTPVEGPEPQLNFFHEAGLSMSEAQQRLHTATVSILGLSGPGANVVELLLKAGIGTVRCIDSLPVAPEDIYLSSVYKSAHIGANRTEAIRSALGPDNLQGHNQPISTDQEVAEVIGGSTLVLSCLDAGMSSLTYKLNRACLATQTTWISCSLSGTEVVVGPTVVPYETACYLCYKMRLVGCAGNPEDGFAFEKLLDKRKRDDSGRRENLAMASGIAANLLALEALKEIAGLQTRSTRGKIVVFDLLDLSSTKRTVLRKPWCPACFRKEAAEQHDIPSLSIRETQPA